MMASPAWLIFAHLIVDDLECADGRRVDDQLGGAGVYAALGASLVGSRPAALVSGIGDDLLQSHRDWLRAWDIDTTALVSRGAHTPHSRVIYRADGSRSETPVYGMEHFQSMAPGTEDVPCAWTDIRGIYFFGKPDAAQWNSLLKMARRGGSQVLWEISADSCRSDLLGAVRSRLADVQVLSINLDEARALCGMEDPWRCLALLRANATALILLRMGSAGALVADRGGTWQVAAAPVDHVVDPTGAGNCYSGAFLAAWCENGAVVGAARIAGAAASKVLCQFGVPPPDRGLRPAVAEIATHVAVRELTTPA